MIGRPVNPMIALNIVNNIGNDGNDNNTANNLLSLLLLLWTERTAISCSTCPPTIYTKFITKSDDGRIYPPGDDYY